MLQDGRHDEHDSILKNFDRRAKLELDAISTDLEARESEFANNLCTSINENKISKLNHLHHDILEKV